MSEIKFTEEETKELAELQQKFNGITVQFGQLKLQKMDLDDAEKQLIVALNETRTQSKDIATKLSAKYGSGTFNPETGIFTPDETPVANEVPNQAPPKLNTEVQ